MDDGHAFDSRVEALRERGFEVAEPTGDLASQEMLYIEEQAELASKIKSMVLDLPPHREEEKQAFRHRALDLFPEEARCGHGEDGRAHRRRPCGELRRFRSGGGVCWLRYRRGTGVWQL